MAPILPNSQCFKWVQEMLTPDMICIKVINGAGPCSGDSGGPLVLADGPHTVVGVSSFGSEKCGSGVPAVFTRVTSFLNWIHSIMQGN